MRQVSLESRSNRFEKCGLSIKIILHRIISVVYFIKFVFKLSILAAMMMSYMTCSERENLSDPYGLGNRWSLEMYYSFQNGLVIDWVVVNFSYNMWCFWSSKHVKLSKLQLFIMRVEGRFFHTSGFKLSYLLPAQVSSVGSRGH